MVTAQKHPLQPSMSMPTFLPILLALGLYVSMPCLFKSLFECLLNIMIVSDSSDSSGIPDTKHSVQKNFPLYHNWDKEYCDELLQSFTVFESPLVTF